MTSTNPTDAQQGRTPSARIRKIRARALIDGYRSLTLKDGTASLALVQARADVLEILDILDTRATVAEPSNEELRSACCDAPTRTANTDYTICTACKEACDTVTAAPSSPVPAESESPILAFDKWLMRYVADCGKLSQKEYGIAYAAFIAAHPGEGPLARTMNDPAPPERTPVAGEQVVETEICPVCKDEVPLDSLLSYNNIPNAFCQQCVDSGKV